MLFPLNASFLPLLAICVVFSGGDGILTLQYLIKKAYHVAQKLCSICRNGEIYSEKHGLIRSSANLIRSSMNFMFVKGFML